MNCSFLVWIIHFASALRNMSNDMSCSQLEDDAQIYVELKTHRDSSHDARPQWGLVYFGVGTKEAIRY